MEEGAAEMCMFLTRSDLTGRQCVACTSVTCRPSLVCCLPSIQVSGTLQPRRGHSTTVFCLVDGVTKVTMFGGTQYPWGGSQKKQSKLADTTLLHFCKK